MEKKQSSIDFLQEQYYTSEGKLSRQDFEQAKAMHKEEMKEMYLKGIKNYDPTFGGKNE